MPLYEYQCKKCKHKFEKIQKFSDRPIKKCPECGGPVEKVMHAPAVQFKGTGWYVTDYAGKNKMETPKTESSSRLREKRILRQRRRREVQRQGHQFEKVRTQKARKQKI